MVNRIEAARRSIDAASDETDDRMVRENLRTLSEGLLTVEEDEDRALQGERLEEIEDKLTSLADEAADDAAVLDRLREARDHLDAYRRDRAQNW